MLPLHLAKKEKNVMSSASIIMTIAKKEFADKLHEKSIVLLAFIFMSLLFINTHKSDGLEDVVRTVAIFFPLLGIALAYSSINSEKNSKSLNVLLTHPVSRGQLLLGKLFGICLSILCVVFLSMTFMFAADLIISGKHAQIDAMLRLYIFGLFTFLYIAIYVTIGFLSSVLYADEDSSLAFGIIFWINLCFVFGSTVIMLSSLITGENFLSATNLFPSYCFKLFYPSPIHHFSKVTLGIQDMSYGTFNVLQDVNGFFDTRFHLSYLFEYYFDSIVYLTFVPFVLMIATYFVFLRKDI